MVKDINDLRAISVNLVKKKKALKTKFYHLLTNNLVKL